MHTVHLFLLSFHLIHGVSLYHAALFTYADGLDQDQRSYDSAHDCRISHLTIKCFLQNLNETIYLKIKIACVIHQATICRLGEVDLVL